MTTSRGKYISPETVTIRVYADDGILTASGVTGTEGFPIDEVE